MHEIVTIQLGRRANYLCTHYWNTQESYQSFAPAPPSLINHDVHFRQGLAADATETYLPRTLIYDLKPGFGSLARTNVLGNMDVDDTTTDTLWNGTLTRLPPVPQPEPSPYAKSLLASAEPVLPTVSTTPFFADFASTYYHPRSLIPITPPYPIGSQNGATEVTSFAASGSPQSSSFEAGIDLFAARDADVDILDTDFRLWMEECDSLQAVQIFTSSDDAWAGFAVKYIERLRDELGKGCIWVWGIDATSTAHEVENEKLSQAKRREQLINSALTVHGLAEQASMYVPLSIPDRLPPAIKLDRRSLWHTSAFLEAAVESSTLPTRIRETDGIGYSMRDWQDVLSNGGRRTIAQLSFDPDYEPAALATDTRMRTSGPDGDNIRRPSDGLSTNISLAPSVIESSRGPHKVSREKRFAQVELVRAPQDILDKVLADHDLSDQSELTETYRVPICFDILPTYPTIFSSHEGIAERSLRARTSITTSSGVTKWVRSLQSSLRLGVGSSLGGEEREAVYNSLGEIAEKYVEDWESADEDNDDDD